MFVAHVILLHYRFQITWATNLHFLLKIFEKIYKGYKSYWGKKKKEQKNNISYFSFLIFKIVNIKHTHKHIQ